MLMSLLPWAALADIHLQVMMVCIRQADGCYLGAQGLHAETKLCITVADKCLT